MSTITPTTQADTAREHERRVIEACGRMPVTYFKAIKALFYTTVMLAGATLTLRFGADATIVFAGFALYVLVYVTEAKEVQLAGLLSATFYRDNGDGNGDDD